MNLWKPSKFVRFDDGKKEPPKKYRNRRRVGFSLSREAHTNASSLMSFLGLKDWDEFFEFFWENRTTVVAIINKEDR